MLLFIFPVLAGVIAANAVSTVLMPRSVLIRSSVLVLESVVAWIVWGLLVVEGNLGMP
jgi:hypothetical protein